MALLYNMVSRKNPLRPEDPEKLYLTLHGLGLIKAEIVTNRITERIGIHKDICKAVLNAWNEVAIDYLTNGHSVELGDAGYVYLRASSEGVDTEEDATVDLVKNINGRFAFSRKTKEAFNEATLVNVRDISSGVNKRNP